MMAYHLLRITENAPFDINAYLLPFAIVVGICFIIMLGRSIAHCSFIIPALLSMIVYEYK